MQIKASAGGKVSQADGTPEELINYLLQSKHTWGGVEMFGDIDKQGST